MPANPLAAASGAIVSSHFLVSSKYLNHAGTLFGGVMMMWADELAYIAATLAYPECTFTTKVFETFDFFHGAIEGTIVRIDARIISRGTSSVRVGISGVWATTGQPIFSTQAVMVNARNGKSCPIPTGPQ